MKRRGSYLAGGIAASLAPPPSKSSKVAADRDQEREAADATPPTTETEAGLTYLKSLFPLEQFEPRLPAIVMKHQMYSIVQNKTAADRELMSLRDRGRIRLFKLGESSDNYAVVFTENYTSHVKTYLGDTSLFRKFLSTVLSSCRDVSITRRQLHSELKVSNEDITTLVNRGILLVRDVGQACSWWFAIPGVSPFIKQYTKGRAMVQQMIKRSKYREILQKELEGRKLTVSKLGMEYHIRDIIGAELVECVETTSGPLLRLVDDVSTDSGPSTGR